MPPALGKAFITDSGNSARFIFENNRFLFFVFDNERIFSCTDPATTIPWTDTIPAPDTFRSDNDTPK